MDNFASAAQQQLPKAIDNAAETSASSLQQFILGQLNNSNGPQLKSRNGFVVPKLQLGNQPTGNKFTIPLLKTSNSNADISTSMLHIRPLPLLATKSVQELSREVNKLTLEVDNRKVQTSTPAAIDLTSALSDTSLLIPMSKSANMLSPTSNEENEDFEIPFIECDRQLIQRAPSITWDNGYEPAPEMRTSLAAPSSCGRIICLNYRNTSQMPYIDHSFKVKHKIKRFRFDTQSPDDLVQASLNQFQRSP